MGQGDDPGVSTNASPILGRACGRFPAEREPDMLVDGRMGLCMDRRTSGRTDGWMESQVVCQHETSVPHCSRSPPPPGLSAPSSKHRPAAAWPGAGAELHLEPGRQKPT